MTGILRRIEELRLFTGECLAKSFAQMQKQKLSEKALADLSLEYLRQNKDLYEDGWYAPPPHGIISNFGKRSESFARVTQPSFRPKSEWPRDDLHYNPEDIVLLYASPIEKKTGLIGDFGLYLYSGPDRAIREHFERVLNATLHIASQATVGMTFRELYQLAMEHGKTQGFFNNIESASDSAGTNIGHTIPLSFPSDPAHNALTDAKNYEEVKESIRANRIFVNSASDQRIEENMAFTIEPRFSTGTMPNTMFHLTVIFENGEQRICHGFKPIMEQAGMDYLMKRLP